MFRHHATPFLSSTHHLPGTSPQCSATMPREVRRHTAPKRRAITSTIPDSSLRRGGTNRITVAGHPTYPRSPGIGCTLTPAAVRNWRI